MLKFRGHDVYLACGHTDMRKAINGLSALVEMSFKLDPFSGAMFVFCNRNRDRLKILEWDGDGYWIHCKRLEKGHFKWPLKLDGHTMRITSEELEYFLESTKLVRKILRQEVTERASF
jgi:transposase